MVDSNYSNDIIGSNDVVRAKEKLKICVVGPSKYFFSGVSAHTIFLSNALSKENEVSVILLRKLLPQFLYPGKEHLNKDNFLISLNEDLDVYDKFDWNSPSSWITALKFLRKHKPDAIVMLWWTSSVAHMQIMLALTNKFFIKAKLILEIHEIVDPLEEKTLPIRLYARLALKLLLKSADAFTAHSTYAKDQISQLHRIDKNKIFVKPFGLYEDYKYNYDSSSTKAEFDINEDFVILSFGSIRKYKGIKFLVEAFSTLPESVVSNSRLVIAGEYWGDDDELLKLVEISPHRLKITFNAHYIEDKDIPKYFSIADVVVLPYTRSFGSGVASIAMSYGKAIITSDLESMRECLKDYPGVYFTPLEDSNAIKENLLNLFHLKEAGDKINFDVPQNSWNEISIKYMEIINQIQAK